MSRRRARDTPCACARSGNFLDIEGELLKRRKLRRLLRDKDVYRASSMNARARSNDDDDPQAIAAATDNIRSKAEPLPSRELKRAVHRASEFMNNHTQRF